MAEAYNLTYLKSLLLCHPTNYTCSESSFLASKYMPHIRDLSMSKQKVKFQAPYAFGELRFSHQCCWRYKKVKFWDLRFTQQFCRRFKMWCCVGWVVPDVLKIVVPSSSRSSNSRVTCQKTLMFTHCTCIYFLWSLTLAAIYSNQSWQRVVGSLLPKPSVVNWQLCDKFLPSAVSAVYSF